MKKLANALFILLSLSQIAASIPSGMVDPTRPPDARDAAGNSAINGPLTLTAIFAYPGYFKAIINQHTVMVGDQIGDFSVTSITLNTVELTGSGEKKVVLELTPDIKQRK